MKKPRFLLVVIAVAVSGCAVGTPATPASPAEMAAVEQSADDLYTTIYGDATQREASRYLARAAMLEPYNICMAEAGFTVDNPYLPQWSGWTPDSTEGIWMGKLQYRQSPAMVGRAALEASATAPMSPNSPQATEAYQAASNSCQDTVVMDLGNRPGEPTEAGALLGEYHNLIAAVDAQLGPIEPYATCMAAAGFDYRRVVSDDEGAQGTIMFLAGKAPAAPQAGEEPSAKWREFLVLEQQVLDADEQCRTEKYHQGLSLLRPLLEDFRTRHADSLETVAAGWDETVARARSQGFKG